MGGDDVRGDWYDEWMDFEWMDFVRRTMRLIIETV